MVVFQDQKQLPGDKLRVRPGCAHRSGCKNGHNWRGLFFLINHVIVNFEKDMTEMLRRRKKSKERVLIGFIFRKIYVRMKLRR